MVDDGVVVSRAESLAGGGSLVVLKGKGPLLGGTEVTLISHTSTAERLGLGDGAGPENPAERAISAVFLMLLALRELDDIKLLEAV